MKMFCPYCHIDLVREVGDGLVRCFNCGRYFTEDGYLYKMATLGRSVVAERSLGNLMQMMGEISRKEEVPSGLAEWELKLVRDPFFDIFLKTGPGKTGIGPKTVGDFLALPENDKKFYAEVFKNWKKTIREKGLAEKLKKFGYVHE